MRLSKETKKVLRVKIRDIDHKIAVQEDMLVAINRDFEKITRKKDKLENSISELRMVKTKIEDDIK